MATDTLRVNLFRHDLRYDLQMMYHISRTQTYTELLNLAIGVEADQKAIGNYSMSKKGLA